MKYLHYLLFVFTIACIPLLTGCSGSTGVYGYYNDPYYRYNDPYYRYPYYRGDITVNPRPPESGRPKPENPIQRPPSRPDRPTTLPSRPVPRPAARPALRR